MLVQNGEVCSVDASVPLHFCLARTWKSEHYFTKSTGLAVCVMMDGFFAVFRRISGLFFGVGSLLSG